MKRAARVLRFLGYAACGPITGALLAGFVRNRKGRPLLATLYAIAIPCAWVDLTLLLDALRRPLGL